MTADAWVAEALVLHRQGLLGPAEERYRAALEADPDHADANHLLGVIRHQQGRTAEALPLVERALKAQPANAEMLSNHGGMLKTLGRAAEALAAYDAALAAKPDHAAALNGRGAVLLDANRYEEALAAYDAAIRAEPDFAVALANRGRVLQFLGRFDAARGDFQRALALEPERTGTCLDYVETTRITPDDPVLARIQTLLARSDLPDEGRVQLEFAMAKAMGDLGDERAGFRHLVRGNALKRARTRYDEALSARFFARVEEVFTPALMAAKSGSGDPSRRPIFILGMMRSGSTLVEQILASHPDVAGGGELTAFINAARAHAEPYPDCLPGLDSAAPLAAHYLAAIAPLAPEGMRVTDKMPSNFFWAGLIHLAFPNAVIIHTRRDALDTCVSCFSKLFLEEHPYTYDLGELGRFWKRYDRLMAHWHAILPPGRILDVQYEDVVADLETQARRIIAHCGLAWDERCLAFHANQRPIRTASVAQVRQPIYGSAVGKARTYEEFLGPLREALATSA